MICKRPRCFGRKKQDILYFFYQCVTEKLFDYTPDTYKLSLLNTHTICKEIMMLNEYEQKHYSGKKSNKNILKPFLDEFEYVFSKDNVAANIAKNIEKSHNKIDYIKNIEYALSCDKQYYKQLKRTMLDIIENNLYKDFDYKIYREFDSVINRWLIELKYYGYKKEYIYLELRELIKKEKEYIGKEKIQKFINIFDFKRKIWSYTLKINYNSFAGCFNQLIEIMQRESVKIIEINDTDNKDIKDIKLDVCAIDPYRGYEKIIEYFNWLTDYVVWSRHIEKNIILNSKCDNYRWGTLKNKPVMLRQLRRLDSTYEKTSELLFSVYVRSNREIRRKLDSVINIHGSTLNKGIGNSDILLHLWTALELLFIKSEKRKGEQVRDNVLTIIQATFLRKRIQYLQKDFINTIKIYDEKLVDKYKLNSIDSFMKILFMDSEPNDISLIINNNPLLRTRIINLILNEIGNTNKILKTIKKHKKIIQWEIDRIYALRNILTHSGGNLFYEKDITEHLHNYLDYVFNYIVSYSSSNDSSSIDEIIVNTSKKYDEYIGKLEDNNIKIDKDNFGDFLFYDKYLQCEFC